MKKIIKMFMVLFILLCTINVFAGNEYELVKEEHHEIYYSRYGKVYASYPFTIFKLNDIYAYCIEPGNHITTTSYIEGELESNFSKEKLEKLELIGYYGRDYPGHDNIRYSMATQALVWELTGVDKVTFWTKKNEEGDEIDVTSEKNEIMRLVNNHKVLPSFGSRYDTTLNHEIILEDTNNVLSNYEINSIHRTYIEGNKLHIIPLKTGIDNIILKRKDYNKDYKTIIFVGKDDTNTQKMARLHYSTDVRKDVIVITEGARIVLHKLDENNNPVKLSNIKFKLVNRIGYGICSTYSDCLFRTNEDGIFITNPLETGEYEIEEVEDQTIPGYKRNKEKLIVKINSDMNIKYNNELKSYIDVYFNNQSIKGSLEIEKQGEEEVFENNNVLYKENKVSNIVFDIYDINSNLVNTITTDTNGYAKVDNLKVGKYYLIEHTPEKYVKEDKIEFEIKQNNEETIPVKLVIKNILKKGRLEFIKVDSVTNKGIPNTIMEIYSNDNKLLFTKETDNEGKIIIDNLPYGKYYIKEKQANYNYQLTNEIINFEIKDDKEVIRKELSNDKILGNLEIIKYGEKYSFNDNEIVYEKVKLPNVYFNIYNSYNDLVCKVKTDNEGIIKVNDLELGKYYYIEENELDNYIIDNEKHYFEIVKDGNKAVDVKLEIDNYLKKGTLEFSKLDLETNEGISDTIIEIYDENDNLLFTKTTDISGKVIINKLPIGKYYIIEKEANKLYLLTNEKVYFEIKENNELVNAKMMNERIKIPVPKTRTNESIIAHSIFGLMFIVGIGGMYFERKEY